MLDMPLAHKVLYIDLSLGEAFFDGQPKHAKMFHVSVHFSLLLPAKVQAAQFTFHYTYLQFDY